MLPEAAEVLIADNKKVGGVEMVEVTWVHSWVFPGVGRKVLHRETGASKEGEQNREIRNLRIRVFPEEKAMARHPLTPTVTTHLLDWLLALSCLSRGLP